VPVRQEPPREVQSEEARAAGDRPPHQDPRYSVNETAGDPASGADGRMGRAHAS
jgi:hypothetical protein